MNSAILRYVSSCRNDGAQLKSQQVISMLEQVHAAEFQLINIHRTRLILTS